MNGSVIEWTYDVHSRFYTANNTNLLPLGSSLFRTGPTIISGGVFTSMATANLSSNALNRTMLECSDGTNSSSVLLNLRGTCIYTVAPCWSCCPHNGVCLPLFINVPSSVPSAMQRRFDRVKRSVNEP